MFQNNDALNAGVIFERSYNLLLRQMNIGLKRLSEGDMSATPDAALFAAVCVNGALACELYMKSMLPDIRKHDLQFLFNRLEANEKTEITNRTVAAMRSYDSNYDQNSFLSDLDTMKEGFEDWRYYYQNRPGQTSHLFYNALMVATREVAKAERPSSSAVGQNNSTVN